MYNFLFLDISLLVMTNLDRDLIKRPCSNEGSEKGVYRTIMPLRPQNM